MFLYVLSIYNASQNIKNIKNIKNTENIVNTYNYNFNNIIIFINYILLLHS